MAFNLNSENHADEWIGYFPYTTGIDREGNECMMVVAYDHHASGCNPYHWVPTHYNNHGFQFISQEEAETHAKYAAGSWSVKSVDTDNIKIGAVRFTITKTAVNMGDIA